MGTFLVKISENRNEKFLNGVVCFLIQYVAES